MTAAALSRPPVRRIRMKLLAALLTAACALQLLVAVQHVAPSAVLRMFGGPQAAGVQSPRLNLTELIWSGPVLRAAPDDRPLRGGFQVATADAPFTQVVFSGADIVIDGTTLKTRPLRIAAGSDVVTGRRTFARDLAAARDAQIELRWIEAGSAPTACGPTPPSVAALLHRNAQVDLMFLRAPPGPDAPADVVCGRWVLTTP